MIVCTVAKTLLYGDLSQVTRHYIVPTFIFWIILISCSTITHKNVYRKPTSMKMMCP